MSDQAHDNAMAVTTFAGNLANELLREREKVKLLRDVLQDLCDMRRIFGGTFTAADFARAESALLETKSSDGLIHILGYDLLLTNGDCPEQYDVFLEGKKVGYLRLRHGAFTAETPDCGGHLVYEDDNVPGTDGGFADEAQRVRYLQEAVCRIREFRSAESMLLKTAPKEADSHGPTLS